MIDDKTFKRALLIRQVENKFLELFSEGRLNGTVHTSVGQEFTAIAFAGQLKSSDFIFSNHRCHGHYLEFTQDIKGLIAELMGKEIGTCGGIGSSQHLCYKNFFSNGIQGGILPVSAGYSLANKLKKNNNIGLTFIGDGSLGEGVVYETFNIVSKWEIPLLIVCENNKYAQSTPISINLAGDIIKRAEAFGIETYSGSTEKPEELISKANSAINKLRKHSKPIFFLVDTYRLNAHSKGDDNRDNNEITKYAERDPINKFKKENSETYKQFYTENNKLIDDILSEINNSGHIDLESYLSERTETKILNRTALKSINKRQLELINEFFVDEMQENSNIIFMGEDVLSPYGGAFKVAKSLSDLYPNRVFSTPISEAAITGIANGLALNSMRPFVEIMFGDFITLSLDQIINHASKFFQMYNKKINCPIVIRTPMGGRRSYGPTHSQTLDKFLIGIDNVKIIAVNTLVNPKMIYQNILKHEQHPVIVIENKVDYSYKIFNKAIDNYNYFHTDEIYPTVSITPTISQPTATIVVYGGMANIIQQCLHDIFIETDLKPEIIVISVINPINYLPILESVDKTNVLIVVEEGSIVGGIGSEIIASVAEKSTKKILSKRIGALPVPIPSVSSLEQEVLPNKHRIISEIKELVRN